MAGAIKSQYLGKCIDLEKSDLLVAVRARAGMSKDMHDDLEKIAPENLRKGSRVVGAFEVVDLTPSKNNIEKDLDWLRSRPSVAAASHVFHSQSKNKIYVPTGNIHLVFVDQCSARQQQAVFSQFRLQVIEARGSKDFLVSITSGSKNPIVTASALQQESGVGFAEPEFAAL